MADATELGGAAAAPTSASGKSTAAVQQREEDDFGRDSCALLGAMDSGGAMGMEPHHLPISFLSTTILQIPAIRIGHVSPLKDTLRSRVHDLLTHIKKLGNPHPNHVQSAIARHIHSSMHLEGQALSMTDTLALVTTGLDNTSDEAKLATNMLKLMSTEYTELRPLETVTISVEKLCGWHTRMFANVECFKDKHVGKVRRKGAGAGSRLFPSRSIVDDELPTLCAVVTDFCARWKGREHDNEVDAVLEVFALATFTQYHFLDLHPFADGNGRMCRYLCKYILESCLPLPFPMYDSRDDYLNALRAGDDAVDSLSALHAPAQLLEMTIDSAVAFYAELNSFVVCPFLRSPTWQGIARAAESRELVFTDDDSVTLQAKFASLEVSKSETVQLSIGNVKIEKSRAPLQLTRGGAPPPLQLPSE